MIIKNKDWRWSADNAIEIWWDGRWLTSAQIAWADPKASHAATIENRFRRAIGGDSKYERYSASDLVLLKSVGRKDLIVGQITRCPRTLAILHFWAGAFEEFPFKLFLVATRQTTCEKKHYSKGLCKYCSQKIDGSGTSTLSAEGIRKKKEREASPERKREKTLAARRRLLIQLLLDLQPEPLSIAAVKMIVDRRYGDLTTEEHSKFLKLTFDTYEAKWLELCVDNTEAVTEFFRIKKEKVSAVAMERIRKMLDELLNSKKKS